MFVGRGPVAAVHVATTGTVPTTRVTVDLLRPATYRVIPPEEGEKDFTVLFEEDAQPLATTPPNPARLRRVARPDRCAADPRRDWRGRRAGRGDCGRDEGRSWRIQRVQTGAGRCDRRERREAGTVCAGAAERRASTAVADARGGSAGSGLPDIR